MSSDCLANVSVLSVEPAHRTQGQNTVVVFYSTLMISSFPSESLTNDALVLCQSRLLNVGKHLGTSQKKMLGHPVWRLDNEKPLHYFVT